MGGPGPGRRGPDRGAGRHRPGSGGQPIRGPHLQSGARLLRRDIEDLLDDLPAVVPVPERPERPEHPERHERPERPERPGLRATRRVPAGTVLQPIEVPARELEALIRRSLTERHERAVWAEAGDEVVVDLVRTRVAVATGLVLIAVSLRTDDTQPTELVVQLAVGTPTDITGLLAVTPRAPEGPAGLVLRWGDAVIAAAWGALVDVVTELAHAVGSDERGAPLQPAALLAQDGVLGIVLQAAPEPPDHDEASDRGGGNR